MEGTVINVKSFVAKNSGNPFDVVTLRLPNGFAGRVACFNGEAAGLAPGDVVDLDIIPDYRNNLTVTISR